MSCVWGCPNCLAKKCLQPQGLFVALFSRSSRSLSHVAVRIHSFPATSTTPGIKSSFVYRSREGGNTLQAVVSGSWHVIEHEQCLGPWDLRLASPQGGGVFKGSWGLTLCHLAVMSPTKSCWKHGECGASWKWSAGRVRHRGLHSGAELCKVWSLQLQVMGISLLIKGLKIWSNGSRKWCCYLWMWLAAVTPLLPPSSSLPPSLKTKT